MRTLFLFALLLVSSCARHISEAQQSTTGSVADKSPIVATLTHFRGLPDLWLPKTSADNSILLVDNHYETTKGFISAAQLSGDVLGQHCAILRIELGILGL